MPRSGHYGLQHAREAKSKAPLIGEVAAQLTERLLFTHIYAVK